MRLGLPIILSNHCIENLNHTGQYIIRVLTHHLFFFANYLKSSCLAKEKMTFTVPPRFLINYYYFLAHALGCSSSWFNLHFERGGCVFQTRTKVEKNMYPHTEINLPLVDERGHSLCVWWYFFVCIIPPPAINWRTSWLCCRRSITNSVLLLIYPPSSAVDFDPCSFPSGSFTCLYPSPDGQASQALLLPQHL